MPESNDNSSNDQATLLCEFAVKPFADCYCLSITGSSIPKISKYCMASSNGCPIYAGITAKIVTPGQG